MTNDLATDNAYKQHINRLQNEVNRSFGKTVTSIADFEELSEKIGIDKSTFYRRLESNGKKFTIEEVIKIANVLNLDRKKVDSIFFDITVA